MSKKFLIKEMFGLNNEQYSKLREKYSQEKIIKSHSKFLFGNKKPGQVGIWNLYYFIDEYGDFLNKGKLCHHSVARAVYECMGASDKVDILGYIDEVVG